MIPVPIMVCGFNRPDMLRKVLEAVREASPQKLYLVLDAPRPGHDPDWPGYKECRKLFDSVDWAENVHRNYAETNMGCGKRMTTGINWVFEHEDRAIILEDDCVPDALFFKFCDELLEKYKEDNRIGAISGHMEPIQLKKVNFFGASYCFDRMFSCWGWATWRRAWRYHDPKLSYLGTLSSSGMMMELFSSKRYLRLWTDAIWKIHDGKRNTWAGAWATTIYREGFLVIHPNCNLITNVGTDDSSRSVSKKMGPTLRIKIKSFFEARRNVLTQSFSFPIKHPASFIINASSERCFLAECIYASIMTKFCRNPLSAMLKVLERLNII